MQDKLIAIFKVGDSQMEAELNFIEDGFTIINMDVSKSVLIKYNSVRRINTEINDYINIIYEKETKTGSLYLNELIRVSDNAAHEIEKRCKVKIQPLHDDDKGKSDSLLIDDMCKLRVDADGYSRFMMTHKKLILTNTHTNTLYPIYLSHITEINRQGQSFISLKYDNDKYQEIYYTKADKLISYIQDYRYRSDDYKDDFDVNEAFAKPLKKKNKKKRKKIIKTIGIIIFLIIAALLFLY